ncbi:MAG: LysR family transcriptional regulator [Coriobacteriaceae bacterium]|nr:MAG: LysR family transcriptional regulator [Coriobacteriaceae bacterium]
MHMTPKQLEYFVAVAEELSFTKAAKRLFVSESSVSTQLKSLEREVGCKLLYRDNHRVELTPAGSSFLVDALAIISRADDAVRRARAADQGPMGELRVGYIKGFERTDLGDMLYDFHMHYPNVRLSFLRENVAELYDALRAEKIDVAINLLYSPDRMRDLQWTEMRDYPLLAVVPANHPLAHRGRIRMKDLSGFPLVDIHRGKGGYGERETIAAALEEVGSTVRVSYVSEDVETSLLCVASGLGYALLPGYLTATLPRRGKVVALPIEGMEHQMHVVAAWLPTRKNDLLDVFLDEFLRTG